MPRREKVKFVATAPRNRCIVLLQPYSFGLRFKPLIAKKTLGGNSKPLKSSQRPEKWARFYLVRLTSQDWSGDVETFLTSSSYQIRLFSLFFLI